MSTEKRQVLAFTGIRSDYDLLSTLFEKIHTDPAMRLGLIVSGAHLSSTYGDTVRFIEEDHLPILAKIESLLDADTPSSRLKSAAILMQSCLHTVTAYHPDVIVYAGDREDAMVGALVGAYLKIPTVHFFGGDHATDGNVDNPVRHAVSKLSSVHFVSHASHQLRLKRMGEPSRRIFNIGNPAIDRLIHAPKIDRRNLLSQLGRPRWNDYALVIFHPILGHEEKAGSVFETILGTLKKSSIPAFVSYPNTDAGNKAIIRVIQEYTGDPGLCFYRNLPRTLFVNLMRHAAFMIGNSSAGLMEAPAIPLGAVNVGPRQTGRLAAKNVVFCGETAKEIGEAVRHVLGEDFQRKMKHMASPYGKGDSSLKAYRLLKRLNFKNYLFKTEDPLTP
jgi:GDP/UDP-N,N'-diacetylbacillosamine 2-epimerase (hydrolysing)